MKESILKRYPELSFDDVGLRDDGDDKGIYINIWKSIKPKPSIQQINTWVNEDKNLPPTLSPIEELRKQQSDLVFELMMKGIL